MSVAGIDMKMKEYFDFLNSIIFFKQIETGSFKKMINIITGDHGIHYGKYYNEIENTFPPLIIV